MQFFVDKKELFDTDRITSILPSNLKQVGKIDLNTAPEGWCVVTNPQAINLPQATEGWSICFTLKVTNMDRFQVCIPYGQSDLNIYIRSYGGHNPTWSKWKKLMTN